MLQTILHYMVSSGTGQLPREPSRGVRVLLRQSGLMAGKSVVASQWGLDFVADAFGSDARLQITSAGFQFLLHTPHEQLWQLLLQYLKMAEVCGPLDN
jgi:transcription initiation factor TFIIH subunit 4